MPKRIQLEDKMTQFYNRKVKEGDRDTYWDFLKSYFPPKNILRTEEIARRTREAAVWIERARTDYSHHTMIRAATIASAITDSLSTCTNYETAFKSERELTDAEMLALAKENKKKLISFAVRFLKDYSTFSIFHPLRSHRTEVDHLCTALMNLPTDGSWNFSDFEKAIADTLAEAKREHKPINPHGAFQRRITFVQEVAALLKGMYSGTEPKPVAGTAVKAADTAASAPTPRLGH